MTYMFAKTLVHDLDAMADFDEKVLGMVRLGRHPNGRSGLCQAISRAVSGVTSETDMMCSA